MNEDNQVGGSARIGKLVSLFLLISVVIIVTLKAIFW